MSLRNLLVENQQGQSSLNIKVNNIWVCGDLFIGDKNILDYINELNAKNENLQNKILELENQINSLKIEEKINRGPNTSINFYTDDIYDLEKYTDSLKESINKRTKSYKNKTK